MQPDTGETTAAINRRADDDSWKQILPRLEAGATLVRVSGLRRYYVDPGSGPEGPGLSEFGVRRLERQGVLKYVGVDRYGLAEKALPE